MCGDIFLSYDVLKLILDSQNWGVGKHYVHQKCGILGKKPEKSVPYKTLTSMGKKHVVHAAVSANVSTWAAAKTNFVFAK